MNMHEIFVPSKYQKILPEKIAWQIFIFTDKIWKRQIFTISISTFLNIIKTCDQFVCPIYTATQLLECFIYRWTNDDDCFLFEC